MTKRFSFWLWGLIIMQLLTAAFHSLSFIAQPAPANDTEKQMLNLITSYKMDAGAGFHPTWYNLFMALSSCFTFICLLAGVCNWYFKKKNISVDIWKGFLLIQAIIFGAMFLVMLFLTFLPPVICTGLIFVSAVGSFLSVK